MCSYFVRSAYFLSFSFILCFFACRFFSILHFNEVCSSYLHLACALIIGIQMKRPPKKRRETHTDTNQPQNRSSDSSMRHNCRIVDTLCRWKSGQICVLQFMCIGLVRAMEKNIGLRHCSRFFVCSFFRSACVRYHGLCV